MPPSLHGLGVLPSIGRVADDHLNHRRAGLGAGHGARTEPKALGHRHRQQGRSQWHRVHRQVQLKRIDLRRLGRHTPARLGRQCRRQRLCPRAVARHLGQLLAQALAGTEHKRVHGVEAAGEAGLPRLHGRHQSRIAQQHAAGQAAQAFVKAHVDRVGQRCDLGQRPVVMRGRLPQPRAIEMQGHALSPAPGAEGHEFVPGGQAVAAAAQRQLHHDHPRPLGQGCQLGGGEGGIGVAHERRVQTHQLAIGLGLVDGNVALRMHGHGAGAAAAPHPQHGELSRHPFVEEARGRLAKERGQVGLQGLQGGALAVDIRRRRGFGQVCQRQQRLAHRAHGPVAVEPTGASVADLDVAEHGGGGVGGHGGEQAKTDKNRQKAATGVARRQHGGKTARRQRRGECRAQPPHGLR